ncbi:2-5A-dependent ribonuclease [Symbiodinium microadriaticum]|uniref:2-5A-dependent ribonuclease n=1 Tax=Symbiodinium microadriaticum TaxID=2951 RepID=A0A1Q9CNT6_SYMMI|nr:2-5A-dependent ribonuclease [Symbiodinium microadriaticum]
MARLEQKVALAKVELHRTSYGAISLGDLKVGCLERVTAQEAITREISPDPQFDKQLRRGISIPENMLCGELGFPDANLGLSFKKSGRLGHVGNVNPEMNWLQYTFRGVGSNILEISGTELRTIDRLLPWYKYLGYRDEPGLSSRDVRQLSQEFRRHPVLAADQGQQTHLRGEHFGKNCAHKICRLGCPAGESKAGGGTEQRSTIWEQGWGTEAVPMLFPMYTVVADVLLKMTKVQTLFFWYDYWSCPQLENQNGNAEESHGDRHQANAIRSIPAYVSRCRFFFALCPAIDCPDQGQVLTSASWGTRGWCRLERAARELSPNSTWILVQSETSIEAVGAMFSFPGGSVGEGEFAMAEDRGKLAQVMRNMLVQKLSHCLRVGDMPGFRLHFNLQTVHLRGLEIEPVTNFLPTSEVQDGDVVAEFLHQNGLRSVGKADSAGWWPLHYAALSGNLEVLRGLLGQRADPNRRTSKDEPTLGLPPWISAVELAVAFKHHEATGLLLAARANLEGAFAPVAQSAATFDNVEGLRLLCAAGAQPLARNLFGFSALQCAAGLGARAVVEEIVLQARPGEVELSRALFDAAGFRGGSAELVQRLIGLRADVDFQLSVSRDVSALGRLLFAAKSLQHRLGRTTGLTAYAYHLHGSTPLMQAIRSAQFEAAAALIAAGARLDLRNCRNWSAADFARGQAIPNFLQLGLHGEASECRRVSSLAVIDGYVEIAF